MTFPVVAARTATTDPSAALLHSINLGGPSAGELLVVIAASDDAGGPYEVDDVGGSGVGWMLTQGTAIGGQRIGVFAKVAAGGDALTVKTMASLRMVAICYRISGHGSALVATFVGALGGAADPPNVSISGAAQDLLFIAAAATVSSVATGAPTNYGSLTTASIASNIFLATAERDLNGTSDNPGTFTVSSQRYIAATVAIHELPVTTSARLTQAAAETVSDATPTARLTQLAAEAVSTLSPAARLTQMAVETVSSNVTAGSGAGPSMLLIAT